MEYRKTTWEYKNLGLSSCEIIVERRDTADEFAKLDSSISEEYRVLKLPTDMPELMFRLPEIGYVFMETQMLLSMKRSEFRSISVRNASYEKIQFVEIRTPEELKELAFLKRGRVFVTDRIAIDPLFGPEKAGLRYFNWMNDICARGGSVILAKVDGRVIACSTLEMRSSGTCRLALGGMMASPEEEAYYACMDIAERYATEKLGANRLETSVSSNNIPVLRLHEKKGYHIKGMHYVYVKHAGRTTK